MHQTRNEFNIIMQKDSKFKFFNNKAVQFDIIIFKISLLLIIDHIYIFYLPLIYFFSNNIYKIIEINKS